MPSFKYLFVTTHYLPDVHFGGVVASSASLFPSLQRLGAFSLACVSKDAAEGRRDLGEYGACYHSVFLHKYGFSPAAIWGLWFRVRESDAVLVNGVVTFPVTLAALYSYILGKPFIVAPRGGLEPWSVSQKKWKKYLYHRLITFPLMRRASYIQATSEREAGNLRNLGFSNVIIVPNGVELPNDSPASPLSVAGSTFSFLFLSRTDREKGLDILLPAYRRFCGEFIGESHKLFLVGPDMHGYLAGMKLNYEAENIVRKEPVYGHEKIRLIASSDALVLPSYTENFGNVVAEALLCGVPVITTTGTPWAEIEKIGCGLYVKPEVEALFQAMKTMYLKSPGERRVMGRRGREYVLKNFGWEDKARELFKYLEKLVLAGGK